MKQLLIAMLLLVNMGTIKTYAQESPKPKKENFSWQKIYMDEAGISADVQEKIEAIKTESEAKVKEIRKDATLAEDVKKEKIKEVHKTKGEQINALLSKEQKDKIKAIKERLKKETEGN